MGMPEVVLKITMILTHFCTLRQSRTFSVGNITCHIYGPFYQELFMQSLKNTAGLQVHHPLKHRQSLKLIETLIFYFFVEAIFFHILHTQQINKSLVY